MALVRNEAEAPEGGARNVYELLLRQAERSPEAEALRFLPKGDLSAEPVVVSRSELVSRIARAANLFRSLGVGRNDVVSVLAPNLLPLQYAFWGAELAGAVNPINFLLSPEHVGEIMRATRAKVLVTMGSKASPDIWAKAMAAAKHTPHLQAVLTLGPHDGGGASDFGALLSEADAGLAAIDARQPDETAAYFHTGGTTGAPKLVVHTHANQMHAALATAAGYGFSDRDTLMCGLPMFHVAGPILLILAGLSAGARVLLPTAAGARDPLVIRDYWRIVEQEGVSVVGGVPTTLADVLAQSGEIPQGIAQGRICMTGGAQLSRSLQARFEEATGIPIHQVYGMTETAGVICVAPRSERPPAGSVGRAAAGVAVKVCKLNADGAAGPGCGPGEIGAVFVRGPNVTPGYASGDEVTSACDREGWLHTGDLGYLDQDGWLFLTGRSKDVIIRSGHNIDPASIEEVARSHPDVADAAAVGRPDPRAGEVPVLFAVLRPGASIDADTLREFLIQRVPEAPAKPAAVYLLPALPVTAVGKLFRPALKAEALKRLLDDQVASTFDQGSAPEIKVNALGPRGVHVVVAGAPERIEGPWASLRAWLSEHAVDFELVR